MRYFVNFLRVIRLKIYRMVDFLFEYPLSKISDIERPVGTRKIPAVVYQTCEDNFFSKSHIRELNKFRSFNKEFSFYTYDAKKRDDYMLKNWGSHPIYEIYKRAQYNVICADIFRYCIIYDRGGYYFDINKGVFGSLLKLHGKNASGMISFEGSHNLIQPDLYVAKKLQHPDKLIIQWGFAFKKNSVILRAMIENICDAYPLYKDKVFDSPKFAILSFTGPGMFTKTVIEFLAKHDMGKIYQIGIDFNGKSVLYMKGSRVANQKKKHYSTAVKSIIIS